MVKLSDIFIITLPVTVHSFRSFNLSNYMFKDENLSAVCQTKSPLHYFDNDCWLNFAVFLNGSNLQDNFHYRNCLS